MADFDSLYDRQVSLQSRMADNGMYEGIDPYLVIPQDIPSLASYHVQQLVSEIGEVLEADKRWKNFRNDKYDPDAKLDEIADCFIVLMNIAMFSGFNSSDVYDAIVMKQNIVDIRINRNNSN